MITAPIGPARVLQWKNHHGDTVVNYPQPLSCPGYPVCWPGPWSFPGVRRPVPTVPVPPGVSGPQTPALLTPLPGALAAVSLVCAGAL